MTYEIKINEEQRSILEEALLHYMTKWPGDQELRALWGMFRDLPREEAKEPEALHDFTL